VTPARLLAGAALGIAGLAGCGDDDPAVELVEGVTAEVVVVDNDYEPEAIEVAAGTEVRFSNRGRNEHDVIPVDGNDELTITLQELVPGTTVVRRLTVPGTYPYYCSIHGTETAGMIGSITVTGG
jgi:plastocyanin